jgi:ATP/maltotriose-dependent transcriptional regulator MalT
VRTDAPASRVDLAAFETGTRRHDRCRRRVDESAAARKVTVISAPAGSGKTSLLRAWAARPGQPGRLAVLQAQRGQHDAQQFWLALLGAVRRAASDA